MTIPADDAPVVDVAAESRYVLRGGDDEAELVYAIDGGRMVLVHTGVPDEWSGHGIGGRLVRAVLARAAANELTVVPLCPFARRWLQDHPDEAAAVTVDWATQRLPS
jgi:predicted GNAT family acetyltransferase